MTYNRIRCEAVDVKTESGVCPGLAQTEHGEVFILGPRTPEGKGICCQALSALSSMKLALALTERMDWETKDYFDITCPHGVVTYRLSRARDDSEQHQAT
ncbi:MAG: hypothetical protein JW993_15160 [Sedimentisphaerales bacterium]|nr:hypothetical protein [Sedimentisphaerales bacterium]